MTMIIVGKIIVTAAIVAVVIACIAAIISLLNDLRDIDFNYPSYRHKDALIDYLLFCAGILFLTVSALGLLLLAVWVVLSDWIIT